ncbi:LuxR family transcriptional regulator [Brevibacterium sp. 5221]|uniref:LuxR family transcriptional regulator n=1 Tax=Brevibacterium rongguiense TaxID=2695267 RepID=A0A6N9H8S2_9MICO|nr:cupin domain-containing protein [Brevibacterium rongguiense]MYM20221.1 LuxR family transcriptional regulator [Brevibacterium rongguiense]
MSLSALSRELVAKARGAHAGRAAHMVAGGHETVLSQTVLALAAGSGLAEHDAPPEATLQVLSGRIALTAGEQRWELGTGELIDIPHARHAVEALADSAFLLSVVRER